MADRQIILDTDLGSDVDDALALAVLLGSPEVDLLGCVTVYGDTALRARLAKRLVRLAGRTLTVVPGAEKTLTDREVWWAGHEGKLFADLDTEQVSHEPDATTYLTERVRRAPGEIDVVAIGPLTNIANAIQADPSFAANLRHLWIMGGRFDSPEPEHNFKCDPEAAKIVFDSGAPITVTGLEITTTVRLEAGDVARIAEAGEFGKALKAEIEQWWRFWNEEWNSPHDPITVLTMLAPDLFGLTEKGHVAIDAAGGSVFTEGAGRTRITVAARADEVAAQIVARTVAAPR